jgi:hypothetical protein
VAGIVTVVATVLLAFIHLAIARWMRTFFGLLVGHNASLGRYLRNAVVFRRHGPKLSRFVNLLLEDDTPITGWFQTDGFCLTLVSDIVWERAAFRKDRTLLDHSSPIAVTPQAIMPNQ